MSDETARQAESDLQRKCSSLVDREVVYCVSSLVYQLAQGYGHNLPGDLGELAEEAFEVSTPIEDYEEPVEWHLRNEMTRAELAELLENASFQVYDHEDHATLATAYLGHLRDEDELQQFAGEHNIEPDQREIFEHWIVSKWLADKLRERGERIGEVAGMTVWGRPTTGQAISMDEVIRDIVREMHKEAVA